MDPILAEFRTDLSRLLKLLELLEIIKTFSGEDGSGLNTEDNVFLEQAGKVLRVSKECHPDIVILIGTLVLYLGGRFEYFVRTEFEFLCEQIATRCGTYRNLPREMRESIITMTATVIAEPRKYGHGDQGIKSFITNLATILNDTSKLQDVNSACLSITDANMRADTLDELFQRIGAKGIWDKIGQQAKVLVFFETSEAPEARNKAKSFLNGFMDIRNKIAHPAAGIDWPDSISVRKNIEYFDILAEAISEVTPIYEIHLSKGASQNASNLDTSISSSLTTSTPP
jgi:hypothetical protein